MTTLKPGEKLSEVHLFLKPSSYKAETAATNEASNTLNNGKDDNSMEKYKPLAPNTTLTTFATRYLKNQKMWIHIPELDKPFLYDDTALTKYGERFIDFVTNLDGSIVDVYLKREGEISANNEKSMMRLTVKDHHIYGPTKLIRYKRKPLSDYMRAITAPIVLIHDPYSGKIIARGTYNSEKVEMEYHFDTELCGGGNGVYDILTQPVTSVVFTEGCNGNSTCYIYLAP